MVKPRARTETGGVALLQPSRNHSSEGETRLNPILSGLLEHGSPPQKTGLSNLALLSSPVSVTVRRSASTAVASGPSIASGAPTSVSQTPQMVTSAVLSPDAIPTRPSTPYIIRATSKTRPPKQISIPSVSQLEKVIAESIQRGVDVNSKNLPTFVASSSKSNLVTQSISQGQPPATTTPASAVQCLVGSLSNQVTSLVQSLPDETTTLVKAPSVAVKLKISKNDGSYESKVIEVMKKPLAMEQVAREIELAKRRLPPSSAAVLVVPQRLSLTPHSEHQQPSTIVISGHLVTGDQSGNLLSSASYSQTLEPLPIQQEPLDNTLLPEKYNAAPLAEASTVASPVTSAVSSALYAINDDPYNETTRADEELMSEQTRALVCEADASQEVHFTCPIDRPQDAGSANTLQQKQQLHQVQPEQQFQQQPQQEMQQQQPQEQGHQLPQEQQCTQQQQQCIQQQQQCIQQQQHPQQQCILQQHEVRQQQYLHQHQHGLHQEQEQLPSAFEHTDSINVEVLKPNDKQEPASIFSSPMAVDVSVIDDDNLIDDVEETPPAISLNPPDAEEEPPPQTSTAPGREDVVIDLTEADVKSQMVLNVAGQKDECLTRRRPAAIARPRVPKVAPLCRSSLKPNIAIMRRSLRPMISKEKLVTSQALPATSLVTTGKGEPTERGDDPFSSGSTERSPMENTSINAVRSDDSQSRVPPVRSGEPMEETSRLAQKDEPEPQSAPATAPVKAQVSADRSSCAKRRRNSSLQSEGSSAPESDTQSHESVGSSEYGSNRRRSTRPKVPTTKVAETQFDNDALVTQPPQQEAPVNTKIVQQKATRPSRRTLARSSSTTRHMGITALSTKVIGAAATIDMAVAATSLQQTTPPEEVPTQQSLLASGESQMLAKTATVAASRRGRRSRVAPCTTKEKLRLRGSASLRCDPSDNKAMTRQADQQKPALTREELIEQKTEDILSSGNRIVSKDVIAGEGDNIKIATTTSSLESSFTVTKEKGPKLALSVADGQNEGQTARQPKPTEDAKDIPGTGVMPVGSPMIVQKNLCCPLCDYKTQTQLFLNIHKRSHRPNLSCSICHKVFGDVQSVKDHEETEHSDETKTAEKLLQCPSCDYRTKFQLYMSRHITLKHTSDE
ncbi:hypothetical protein BIW11_01496 [Tropilaelaps mercedesae]|uniref:C2H2-type domain-containing protein n=1 Tax=Tropilaelaps mercedesae TaxID=418985 RepID=A0A1V9XD35_9ACAR|nr:hypothetical protein BIW11_01496 [Tropilaelaps mercedesae]